MTPSLQKIVESKRALRRELAARLVAEKLRMLEAMRERELSIGSPRRTIRNAKSQRKRWCRWVDRHGAYLSRL